MSLKNKIENCLHYADTEQETIDAVLRVLLRNGTLKDFLTDVSEVIDLESLEQTTDAMKDTYQEVAQGINYLNHKD